MEKHFTFMVLLKFTTCKLQYCVLLGLEKKTGEGRLSSDKASKIMQLHCNFTFSTNSMCIYSWLQPLFSLSAVLAPLGIQFTCTGFCRKMSTHSMLAGYKFHPWGATLASSYLKCIQRFVSKRKMWQRGSTLLLLCRYSQKQKKQSMPIWKKQWLIPLKLQILHFNLWLWMLCLSFRFSKLFNKSLICTSSRGLPSTKPQWWSFSSWLSIPFFLSFVHIFFS